MIKQNQAENKQNSSKKTFSIIIILLALLLVMAIAIIFILLRKEPEEVPGRENVENQVKGTIITEDNLGDLMADGNIVEDGYYNVSMSIDWHFKDGVTEDAKVANKTTNTRTVYFDLMTEDTEEVVYSSPYIPVGESMKGFTLEKELSQGTYDMIVRYYLVDDDNVEVSNVSVGITIYVE